MNAKCKYVGWPASSTFYTRQATISATFKLNMQITAGLLLSNNVHICMKKTTNILSKPKWVRVSVLHTRGKEEVNQSKGQPHFLSYYLPVLFSWTRTKTRTKKISNSFTRTRTRTKDVQKNEKWIRTKKIAAELNKNYNENAKPNENKFLAHISK